MTGGIRHILQLHFTLMHLCCNLKLACSTDCFITNTHCTAVLLVMHVRLLATSQVQVLIASADADHTIADRMHEQMKMRRRRSSCGDLLT